MELPHDWLIYNTLDLYEDSIGWYRKTFPYTKDDQQLLLCFDGVYMNSSVYVNGQLVGEWKYGYSAFEHEITDALVEGDNEIIVKVVHQSPNSRWYSGAGIYRNVWLKTRDRNHIVTDGIYVSIKQQPAGWQVELDTELNLDQNAQLVQTIRYAGQVIVTNTAAVTAAASGDTAVTDRQQIVVENPKLWSTDEPNLYELVTELQVVDADQHVQTLELVSQRIGFRDIQLDQNEGFHLNGVKMKMNGV